MVLAVSPRSRPTETHTWYLRRFRVLTPTTHHFGVVACRTSAN
jgi:hypothetical protein